jgi:hypothetical protein
MWVMEIRAKNTQRLAIDFVITHQESALKGISEDSVN